MWGSMPRWWLSSLPRSVKVPLQKMLTWLSRLSLVSQVKPGPEQEAWVQRIVLVLVTRLRQVLIVCLPGKPI